MAEDLSIHLVASWREGDQAAARELFHRYADRLIALVRTQLSAEFEQRFDPEDVVQSAYRSFFAGVRQDRFAVHQGGDLWQLLVVITLHKLQHQVRLNRAQRRTVKREQRLQDEEALQGVQDYMLAHDPSPLEALALADEVEHLMRRLRPIQRRILELRLQGYGLDEIATETQRCPRTVSRVLDSVKEHLEGRPSDLGGDRS
jgi:RNA polymerase sigma factor (sigma-70 family)